MPSESVTTPKEQDVKKFTSLGHDALRSGDLNGACEAFESAAKLANQLKEGFTQRACYFNLGASYVAKGDAKKGIEFLQKALPPEKEADGSANFADLHYNLGIAYDSIGEVESAAKSFETAAVEYKTQDNKEMLAETLMKLGSDYAFLNDFGRASDFFGNACEVFSELGDKKSEVLALSSRVNLLADLKDIEKCGDVLRALIERSEELTDNFLKGKIYNDMGLVYNQLQHPHNAVDCFELALELELPSEGSNADLEREQLRAVLRQNLGAVYNHLSEFEKALHCHHISVELHGKLGNRAAQGQVFCNMGFAYSQMGNFEKSSASFLNAIQASNDAGDRNGQWQASEGFAAVSFLQGKYDRAVEYYKNALAVLSLTGDDSREINERIVSKLANALECQLMVAKKGKKSPTARQKQITRENGRRSQLPTENVKNNRKHRISKTRPRPDNHKLIARGIDGDQTESEDSETESSSTIGESSESDSNSVDTLERQRYVVSHWEKTKSETEKESFRQEHHRNKQSKQNVQVEIHAGHSDRIEEAPRTLPPRDYPDHSFYEQPMDGHKRKVTPDHSQTMSRSHREAYLASLAASDGETSKQQPNVVTESRTCVIQ